MNCNQLIPVMIALWTFSADSAEVTANLACPDFVTVKVLPVSGWEGHPTAELNLNSAAPTSGPPEQHGDLANFQRVQKKGEWSDTYDLDRPFPNGKWLECGYGEHNEVTLSQQLPAPVKKCTFSYQKGAKAGQHKIKIECK